MFLNPARQLRWPGASRDDRHRRATEPGSSGDDPDHPDPIRFFCNEQLGQDRPDQDGKPGAEFFITRKLWDVGNSAPYGHRGDLTTIAEAILVHGGEARASRDAFVALPFQDQMAIVQFLKTLQVLPPGSPPVIIR